MMEKRSQVEILRKHFFELATGVASHIITAQNMTLLTTSHHHRAVVRVSTKYNFWKIMDPTPIGGSENSIF